MVASFRRSISLTGPKTSSSTTKGGTPTEKSYHVRSTSLPCRSHPLISQLADEVRSIRAWQSSAEPAGPPSYAWLRSGLIRLQLLHRALDHLLQLPQSGDSLRRSRSGLAERLLDEFLCFVDAYGSFRSALVCLQELQSAAQVAVRRRDGARLATVARSLRKAEKEVAGLAFALRELSRPAEPALAGAASSESSAAYVELAGILTEVRSVTVSASAAVFQGTTAALSSATAAVAPKSSCWRALRRRLALTPSSSPSKKRISNEEAAEEREEWTRWASERLVALEELVMGLESGSERVFRSLINTRVSLLNILTP